MKRASAVAALALIAGVLWSANAKSSGPSTPLRTDPLDTLIFAALTAPANVSYSGTVQSFQIGSGSSDAAVYRVEHRAPDLTRRVYTAPADLFGYTVVEKGDQNYAIPAGTDLARFQTVSIYCERFNANFGAAPLEKF